MSRENRSERKKEKQTRRKKVAHETRGSRLLEKGSDAINDEGKERKAATAVGGSSFTTVHPKL